MNETLALLKQLFAAYPNTPVDEGTIVVYTSMLCDIPPEELKMAIYHCIRTLKFLPGVTEILEAHRQLKGNLIEQTPAEAWGSVEKAIRGVGRSGMPRFRNALTGRVVEMMGWRSLCDSDKPGVDRAQFMRMYAEIAKRDDEVQRMSPEIRAYFERNVQARLEANDSGRAGLLGELKMLGVVEDDE